MEYSQKIQLITVWALPVIFAITIQEAAHGYIAKLRGDNTAYQQGKLTLNPIMHICPVGTVLVPLGLLWMGGFIFGWAKPVPVNWQNLKKPRLDMALVAFAGPLSNLIMAVLWLLLVKVSLNPAFGASREFCYKMGLAGVQINMILAILNMLPIPPLDGSRIISSILPPRVAYNYAKLEIYGFFILLALLFTGVLGQILGPTFEASLRLLDSLIR